MIRRNENTKSLAVTVSPFDHLQLERVYRAVVAHPPALRDTRNDLRLGVVDDKALVYVTQDMRLVDRGCLVRVQCFRLAVIAPVIDDFHLRVRLETHGYRAIRLIRTMTDAA